MKLQFESDLQYQLDAIEAVCGLFEGAECGSSAFSVSLPIAKEEGREALDMTITSTTNRLTLDGQAVLENLQRVQVKNGIAPDQFLDETGWHFTIEMETGTGKTYVYLRTIFELNKRYGFTKFVIVVPSIAIKEGVNTSMRIMQEHFRTLYDGVEMESFTYDSSKLGQVRNFANSGKLTVMICTIQAITDIDKPSAKAYRVMHTEHDQIGGHKPIEFIQECRPIVIVDEPQNIGEAGEDRGIATLHPLCTLRYSATHKNLFHSIYSLNAVDASVLKLVKEIEVAAVQKEIANAEPYIKLLGTSKAQGGSATLEVLKRTAAGEYKYEKCKVRQGTLLQNCTHCGDLYDNIIVQEIRNADKARNVPASIRLSHLPEPLMKNQATGDIDQRELWRAMIRDTIELHMEKELKLRSKGIKVLSLFFIDRVKDYREYDENRQGMPGVLQNIFEEEYARIMANTQYQNLYEQNPPNAHEVHNGYFSIDKGSTRNNDKEIWVDSDGDSDSDNKAAAAYSLIMKNKETLLDLNTPLKFIFTHTALKEGWDNPNVFQVCVLRDMHSKISRRQALGRGLRICVNQDGVRVREPGVNTLTVIAHGDFKTYAEELQKEYEHDGLVFGVITLERLCALEYSDAKGEPVQLGHKLAEELIRDLKEKGLIRENGKPTEELKQQLNDGTYEVPQSCTQARDAIIARLQQLTRSLEIREARKRKEVKVRHEKLRPESVFMELWKRISKRTTYRVQFKTDQLIKSVIDSLNDELSKRITPRIITVRQAQINYDEAGIHAVPIQDREPIVIDTSKHPEDIPVGDILSTLEESTHLTRKTLSRILTGIRPELLDKLRVNGPQFEKITQQVIKHELKQLMVDGVCYKPVTIGQREYIAQEIFKDSEGYLDKMLETSDKCLLDHVVWEAEPERRFAEEAERSELVKMYVKLPKSFKIPTPLGTYNPDWALVLEIDGKNHLYFVVETKSTDFIGDLRGDEGMKIACARKHFDKIAEGETSPVSYLAPKNSIREVIKTALNSQ